MATPRSDDENQIETQEYELLRQQKTLSFAGEEVARSESVEASENPHTTEPVASDVGVTAQPKKRRKEKDETEREPGSTLFPLSRVQKIIKADWAMPIVAKEATFLISIATEEFIKRLVEACYVASQKEKRATIQHKDLVAVTRKADEFLFLEDVVLWPTVEAPPAKRPKNKTKMAPNDEKASEGKAIARHVTLDQFGMGRKRVDKGDEGDDIVMNADGTMYAAGNADDDL